MLRGPSRPPIRLSTPLPQRLLVANLLAQLAFGLLAMTICIPSMQEWGAIFGAAQSSVQLTFSAYVVTYGGLQLVYGPLSDRVGRKAVLMVGLVLAVAGSIAAALAPGLPWLIAARLVQGAGAAAGMVVGRAMVQDLFEGPQRTRVMAWVGMAMGLCPPLATIVGGQLHVGLGWRANFVLIAGLAGLLLVAAWRGLPDPAPAAPPREHWLRAMAAAYAELARLAAFRWHVLLLATTTATFYAFLGGAPIVLGSFGVGPDGIGFYIMTVPCSYIAGNYVAARVVRHIGEPRLMSLGQAATLGGIALMTLLGLAGLAAPLAFALPLVLLGIGHGLMVAPALAGTVGLVPALAGSAAAVAGLMQQFTGAVGGYAVGLLRHDGAVNLGWLMLAISSVGLLAHLRLLRLRRAGR